jgi:hypothetical protein
VEGDLEGMLEGGKWDDESQAPRRNFYGQESEPSNISKATEEI